MNMTMESTGGPLEHMLSAGDLLPILAVVLAFLLLLMLSAGGLCIGFVKALRSGGSTQKIRRFEVEEARAFQDLQRGFHRMEERIDSLETLFIGPSQSRTYDREF